MTRFSLEPEKLYTKTEVDAVLDDKMIDHLYPIGSVTYLSPGLDPHRMYKNTTWVRCNMASTSFVPFISWRRIS